MGVGEWSWLGSGSSWSKERRRKPRRGEQGKQQTPAGARGSGRGGREREGSRQRMQRENVV
ncbi:hypothetical protein PAHAL_7G342700 [Panicum hallii]|uniref:Uncharacterized protein n=1 Tax=Panicum hallii TaxID=206008 RepID=A0A2T8IEE2_9POAL|nr:hypothetical protein PAHAL_7G342700 [Panicum hallii]